MHNLVVPSPPSNMDSFAPEVCHCGKRTIESHEFWYCSIKCAREDSLLSLDNSRCHYRENVRKAYARGPHLRRMMSVNNLRLVASELRGPASAPSRVLPPKNWPQKDPTLARRDARDRSMAEFPTPGQVTRRALAHIARAGETFVATRQDLQHECLPDSPSYAHAVEEHAFQQISLDMISFPESRPDPPHSSRRVSQKDDGFAAALLHFGKSRKGRDGENTEWIFGHPVNTSIPPVRKGLLHRQKGAPANSMPSSRALRRSASFAGWGTTPHHDPSNQDALMDVIEQLRAEASGSFDPRSLFEMEEAY